MQWQSCDVAVLTALIRMNWKPAPEYLTLYDDITFEPPVNYFDDYSNRGTAAKRRK